MEPEASKRNFQSALVESALSDTVSSSPSDPHDEGWEDVESDVENICFVSLLDDKVFTDLQSMLEYTKEAFNFDLQTTRRGLALDFLETVRLVNYVRSKALTGDMLPESLTKEDFADDGFLRPVLADDAVLFSLDDINDDIGSGDSSANRIELSAQERIKELEGQLVQAQQTIEGLRSISERLLNSQIDECEVSSPIVERTPNDESYFNSYSFRDIHETMLKDTARTDAYRDFIYDNKNCFKDKLVLDVGCGTGILSMMCAKAGAKHVYAIDNSDIIHKARTNVFHNGLQNQISCIHGKIEEVELPVEKVDVVISEWMGYALLYEAMLDSVLWARDRWLAPDGLMVPSDMYLCIAPLSDQNLVMDKISFWNDVYGFEMTSMQEGIFDDVLLMDCQETTIAADLRSEARPAFLHLDLYTIDLEDLEFSRLPFAIDLSRNISSLDGFVIWFDSIFGRPDRSEAIVELSTGPHAPYTHWMQTVMLINRLDKEAISLKKGQEIRGSVGYRRPKHNQRQLYIEVSWETVPGSSSGSETNEVQENGKQEWKIE